MFRNLMFKFYGKDDAKIAEKARKSPDIKLRGMERLNKARDLFYEALNAPRYRQQYLMVKCYLLLFYYETPNDGLNDRAFKEHGDNHEMYEHFLLLLREIVEDGTLIEAVSKIHRNERSYRFDELYYHFVFRYLTSYKELRYEDAWNVIGLKEEELEQTNPHHLLTVDRMLAWDLEWFFNASREELTGRSAYHTKKAAGEFAEGVAAFSSAAAKVIGQSAAALGNEALRALEKGGERLKEQAVRLEQQAQAIQKPIEQQATQSAAIPHIQPSNARDVAVVNDNVGQGGEWDFADSMLHEAVQIMRKRAKEELDGKTYHVVMNVFGARLRTMREYGSLKTATTEFKQAFHADFNDTEIKSHLNERERTTIYQTLSFAFGIGSDPRVRVRPRKS